MCNKGSKCEKSGQCLYWFVWRFKEWILKVPKETAKTRQWRGRDRSRTLRASCVLFVSFCFLDRVKRCATSKNGDFILFLFHTCTNK